jgi:hypothetical protein
MDTDHRRYAPLGAYLRNLPSSKSGITLSFEDIEGIIDAPLPPSATTHHHQWWANQTTGSRAPHWNAAGFKVDGVDLPKRQVRFVRLPQTARPPRALNLQEIMTEVNAGAKTRPIGQLQEGRQLRLSMTRLPSKTLFHSKPTKKHNYAFHVGAIGELQFNIGFEKPSGLFRHGVAFSLETSQTMPRIDPLVPKIERFNEYLRIYPDAFDGLSMWHWTPEDIRSEDSSVAPIPDALIKRDMFIFIGVVQRPDKIDVDWILDDFDRLLPLYEYVEGQDFFPRALPTTKTFIWSPGNKARSVRTTYEKAALSVDKSLRHNVVQDALFKHLEKIHGKDNTSGEQGSGNGTSVDVAVRHGKSYTYYELKTGLSAQSCIREAIGQLMEYSYWPGSQQVDKIVVVGEADYDRNAKAYLARLRKDFSLPIDYKQFDMKSARLL